ncbi:MAG: hypothetical protein KDD70_11590, partial [Bdellovibrionales bacterium]|nr:hypothetical protein [Bdellovibrionales bacterium]
SGSRIEDPKLRTQALEMWSDCIVRQIGRDDNSDEFRDALQVVAERVKGKFNRLDRAEAFNLVAKKALTQKEASALLQDSLPKLDREGLEQTQGLGIAFDTLTSVLRRDPDTRQEVMDFLLAPFSNESINRFTDTVLYYVDTNRYWANVERHTGAVSPLAKLDGRLFYENFWSAPLEARALIAREMLLPVDATTKEQEAEAFKYAIEKAFPDSGRHVERSREFVEKYIGVLPDYEKSLALSALLISAEKSASKGASTGVALATFLENMGPAETKAGQAAESHPDTPEDIRANLARLKTHASEPLRWELFDLIEEQVSPAVLDGIAHYGKVLGSGSLYIAMRVQMKDGSSKVLRVLRPHALERADNGFGYMSALAAEFGEEDPVFFTLRDIIEESRRTVQWETNTRLGVDQNIAAQGAYNGKSIHVDGEKFNFYVPGVSAFGDGFLLLDEVEGEHFIELPEGTAEEFGRKRKLAKAIATFELSRILAGRIFDKDRHGGNCRINGNTIGHFDFGALELEEPEHDDLKTLGAVLFTAVTSASNESDFRKGFFDELKRIRATTGSVPSLLSGVQKALLSLGEYRRYLSDEDFKQVLVSAAASGIHPVIKNVVTQKAMGSLFKGFGKGKGSPMELLGMFQTPPITIEDSGESRS